MGIKDRLFEFINYLGTTPGAFEKNAGLPNATIKNFKEDISSKTLKKLINRHPELNINWLLTGEGEMLVKNNKNTFDTEKNFLQRRVKDLETIVELQKTLLDKKDVSPKNAKAG